MFILLSGVIFSIAIWTAFALLNKGRVNKEIRDVLALMLGNVRGLFSNFARLFALLIKDALQSDFKEEERRPDIDNNVIEIDTSLKHKASSEVNIADDSSCIDQEQDAAVAGFSEEVIQVINEVEENAA